MSEQELAFASVADLARLIRGKELSPVEITRLYLERIEKLNPRLNAYITVTSDLAMEAARRAETEIVRGAYKGVLHGIPVAVKDLFEIKDVPLTCGSKVLGGHVSHEDATVIKRLRTAGAILLGKLHLHEFAWGATSLNPHYGPARNPWNAQCLAGGSSGGSAVAAVAGLAAATLGTDTGGSVRIPASLCGAVGLKPTYGRVSRHGVFPLAPSMDHVGPVVRTVEDAAIMLKEIAGADPRDPTSSGALVPDYTSAIGRGIRGLRMGLLRTFFLEQVEPIVRERVERAALEMRGLGAVVEELSLPLTQYLPGASLAIISSESYMVHERYLRTHAPVYGSDVRARLMLGATIPASRYLKAQQFRAMLYREAARLLEKADVLLAPTTPFAAPPLDRTTLRIDDREIVVGATISRLTRVGNMTGLPAISVPCGVSDSGMPIGLQIIGRPFAEETVLRTARAYETAAGWNKVRPPL